MQGIHKDIWWGRVGLPEKGRSLEESEGVNMWLLRGHVFKEGGTARAKT